MVDGGYDSKFIRMGLLAGTELFVAQGGIEKGTTLPETNSSSVKISKGK